MMNRRTGQVGVGFLLVISFILVIATVIFTATLLELTFSMRTIDRIKALEAAEGGVDTAIFEIKKALTIVDDEIVLDENVGCINSTNPPYQRAEFTACWERVQAVPKENNSIDPILIRLVADGFVPDRTISRAKRRIENEYLITATQNELTLDFAVFTDLGGIHLRGNNTISGKVFSNGKIRSSGNSDANILFKSSSVDVADVAATGTAFHIDGPSQCDIDIDGSNIVTGQASDAKCIQFGDSGTASAVNAKRVNDTYNEGELSCEANGADNAGELGDTYEVCNPALATAVANRDHPITAALINSLQDQADDQQCDVSATEGCNGANADFDSNNCGGDTGSGCIVGPMKVTGDMTIRSNHTVQVKGTLWVTGKVTVNSNATLVLDCATIGSDNSSALIAGGQLNVSSNVILGGTEQDPDTPNNCSGATSSYLLLISTKGNKEIDPPNQAANYAVITNSNSLSGIAASTVGWVKINGPSAAEIANFQVSAAWGLDMDQNSKVTYPAATPVIKFFGPVTVGFDITSYNICKRLAACPLNDLWTL